MAATVAKPMSNSLLITFPQDHLPRSMQEATALFEHIGEIARVDMIDGATTGRVLVTFFDIRCAQRVAQDFPQLATFAPPANHDFRSVAISGASMRNASTNFAVFGDISNAIVQNEDLVVEFFDMRCAQHACLATPGCRPVHGPPACSSGDDGAQESDELYEPTGGVSWPPGLLPPTGAFEAPLAGAPDLAGHKARQDGGAYWKDAQDAFSSVASTKSGRSTSNSSNTSLDSFSAYWPQDLSPTATPTAVDAAAASPQRGGPGTGKPVCEKVHAKELNKFDIAPDRIRAGQDNRTTVMIRNISKSCSQENFLDALANFGLGEQFTFFYMPFDKRRNMHCGFAFLNLKTPWDVLHLHASLPSFRPESAGTGKTQIPAVSYARLQGQDQLVTHFSSSAVMNDDDSSKRPQFFGKEQIDDAAGVDDAGGAGWPKAALADRWRARRQEPRAAVVRGGEEAVRVPYDLDMHPQYLTPMGL